MGFTSIDDYVNEVTAGKSWRQDFSKINSTPAVAYVAGNTYDWSNTPGTPVAQAYSGTALVMQTPTDIGVGGGIYHGGDVSTDTKHLVNIGAYSAVATAVPSVLQLIDVVAYYPGLANNSTAAQTLINSNTFTASSSSGLLLTYTNDFASFTSVKFSTSGTLPTGLNSTDIFWLVRVSATTARVATSLANAIAGTVIAYTDAGTPTNTMTVTPNRYADGAGLRAFVVCTSSATNTGTPVLDAAGFQYTNAAGTSGNVLGAVVNYTAGGTNIPQITKVMHSGVAANNYGFFLPLAAGDTGIRSVQQYKLSTAYGSAQTSALVICKPLATIPLVAASVAAERNLMTQLPSLPRIYDGACLHFMQFAGAATATNSTILGYCDFAWG